MTDHQDFTAGQHTRLGNPSSSMPVRWADAGFGICAPSITSYNDKSKGTQVRSLGLQDDDLLGFTPSPLRAFAIAGKREIPIELKILRFTKDEGPGGEVSEPHATVPAYASEGAAAVDLVYVGRDPIEIPNGHSQIVGTGIAIAIKDPSIVAKIYPRSGLGSKGLVLGNGTGIIDSDYRGEIKVCLHNRLLPSRSPVAGETKVFKEAGITIMPGDRIAQMTFERVHHAIFQVVEEFSDTTVRGTGSFGSTGR